MAQPFNRAPADIRVAHILLFAAVAVPGLLLTATGIVSLALHRFTADVVLGVLTLAFAAWVVVGGFAAWLLLRRSERTTRLQHDFVSGVSHQLRTPLTSIRMMVETLRLGRGDEAERARCLEVLDAETAHLAQMVEEVLTFGRLSAGVHEVKPASLPVEEAVAGALAAFAPHRTGVVAVQRIVEPGLTVRADRRALEQVLVNLLENAVKYGGAGKRVWIRGERDGARVLLAVEDEGPGVPPAQRKRVFQEFYRGEDAATQALPGSGLGLAIARRLVTAQRGTIRVEARPGGGARFVVALPGGEEEPA